MEIAENQKVSKYQSKISKYEFDWLIEQFSQLNDDKVDSEPFRLSDGSEWFVRLHPNGESAASRCFISLYFMLRTSFCAVKANFEVKTKSSVNEKTTAAQCTHVFEGYKGMGWPKLIARDAILNESNGYLVDGTLTIHCEVSVSVDQPLMNNDSLLANQLLLFKSGEYNDCLFVCPDGEVRANKTFLASQSSVFRAMFKSTAEEARTGRVEITDTSKEIMQALVEYTCNGSVSNLDRVMDQLLPVADKYDMNGLKEICALRMSQTITGENVCGRLVIADFHKVENLKKAGIKFLTENLSSMKTLPNYQQLLIAAHQDVVVEIIDSIAAKRQKLQ